MAPDYAKETLLITCASGKQASHLLPLIAPKYPNLRLAVHSPTSQSRLQSQYPNATVLTADLTSPSACTSLLRGVSTVYHINPSLHPREVDIGINMISAAVAESHQPSSTFHHFVLSSVIHTQLRKLLNHDSKRYVEETLIESGLDWTILQPTHFMDMFRLEPLLAQDTATPTLTMNWDPSVKFSFVALKDLAAAAFAVLTEREKHYFGLYQLSSTMPIRYAEAAAEVSSAIGKKIEIKVRSYEDAVATMLKVLFGADDLTGVDPVQRDAAERLVLYYTRRGLSGNPGVLEWLIGRKATGHGEWAREKVEALRAG